MKDILKTQEELYESAVLAADLSNLTEFVNDFSEAYGMYYGNEEDEELLSQLIKDASEYVIKTGSRFQYKIRSEGDLGLEIIPVLTDINSLEDLPEEVQAWIIEKESLQE